MLLPELAEEVSTIRGVGPAMADRLRRLGIATVGDLLGWLPRGYEDRRAITPLAAAARLGQAAADVTVQSVSQLGRWRAGTVRAVVADGSGEAALVCFGRPFLRGVLQPGRRFLVWGSFRLRRGTLECSDFELEPWSEHPVSFAKVVPVYPLTEGLAQGALRRVVRAALDASLPRVEEAVPAVVRAERGLPRKAAALRAVHFPADPSEALAARRALAFEELLWFELAVLWRRRSAAGPGPSPRGPRRSIDRGLFDRLVGRLPFSLTGDQLAALATIEADLGAPAPMARLLQGDVGCGKTLVAVLSATLVLAAGEQAAFAAPTELLARQHAENCARMLEPLGVRVAFLSGSVTGEPRRLLLAALAAGEIDVLFGTHALFSGDVAFKRLGFVIIDEQHKFGVMQRMAMVAKGTAPDLLLMTATPIPRTLALTAFGDLDISTILTLPAGRRPVITHLARAANEQKVHRRVREEIGRGRQAYFVYPVIEAADPLGGVRDAESAFRRLRDEVFADCTVALIHSRVPEEEKARAMAGFAAGRVQVLVATSVVEVGVDVANATVMVVMHAERFGLSTLHQLRGRVGRGLEQSYAFLVYGDELTAEGIERLKIMRETTDGFRIAQRDLELRGPGELLGLRQSGFLRFAAADLATDGDLLVEARDDAARLVAADPELRAPEHAAVARRLTTSPPPAVSAAEGG
jgi:ATP-dependent DNA helicase RecG